MAVCAHELALPNLGEDDALAAVATDYQRADVAHLVNSRKMVPLHRRRRKDGSAICARLVTLEIEVPGPKLMLTLLHLGQARSPGAFLLIAMELLATRPQTLRMRPRELPYFIVFGIGGLALVQWFYFLAIHRLEIGIALLIQYIAPVLVALWARYVLHEPVRRRIWLALILALAGLALVVQIWSGLSLDAAGVAASLGAAGSYALYILMAEHRIGDRDPISLVGLGFFLASIFWAILRPWWTFPAHLAGEDVSLHGHLSSIHAPVWLLMSWMIVLGTIVPFALLVSSLRYISATRAGIVAMLEPVAGALVAWVWLGETLGG